MKFLLIWYVTQTIPVPCPDFKPDPYTGEYPQTICCVYHVKKEVIKMEKEFFTKVELDEFIAHAPDYLRTKFEVVEIHE